MTTSMQLELRQALARRAAEYLTQGYHSSEAVVKAVAPHVVRDWCPASARMATGFAGGLGGTGAELCGALAGGVLVIGALFGRTTLEDDALAQRLTSQFRDRFVETFGTTQCAALKRDVVNATGGLSSCSVLVERATLVLLNLLGEAGVQLKEEAVV